jgi:small subunit ribosomal protein S5
VLLEVRRVTRVTTGGRRMSFRATVLVGNRKGQIGVGLSKGADVTIAVSKASREAYKSLVKVPLTKDNTVPYALTTKYKACQVKLLPAKAGTGLKAGSAVRAVLELAGYENILSKILGSNNKLNNALATIKALGAYKHTDFFTSLLAKKKNASSEEVAEDVVDATEDTKNTDVVAKPVAKKAVAEKAPAKKAPAKK